LVSAVLPEVIFDLLSFFIMNDYSRYFDANKTLWNERTRIHKDSSFYNLDGFRSGKTSLNQVELNEVGDVKGKSLLHLQCHFGLDTLSWSRMGAKCTGVDLSDEAIRTAHELNEEQQLDAKFICCNLYDLKNQLHDTFDIVFTSYGTITWLPELDPWAATISHFLKPGGLFFMAEFHPVLWMFDNQFEKIQYAYHNAGVIQEENTGTYADKDAAIKEKEYSWNHSLEEIFMALLKNGLTIQSFRELTYSPYHCFKKMVKGDDGFYRIAGMEDKIPMMYTLQAIKK
jgi:2-polyprenyl-3-methyl-5-hydroxy-6-metoxy-1,4-benzoquinol methylase